MDSMSVVFVLERVVVQSACEENLMSSTAFPEPVTLIVGIITSRISLFDRAEEELKQLYGPTGLKSDIFDFNFTDYYEEEMGPNLKRKFLSFKNKINPDQLSKIKLQTNELERIFAEKEPFVPRPINLDPGYISPSKLVLATTKDYAHRIYLRDGIYAEVTLIYRNKRFEPLDTTFPDYRTKKYIKFFTRIRNRIMAISRK